MKNVSLILSIILVVEYFSHHSIPEGWTSLMVVLLFVGGIIMFSLGIIGEYIGRIYTESKQRPLYFIQDVFEKKQKKT